METNFQKHKTKALVIGWDGGSFNVLEPMIEKGIMPCLKSVIKDGVSADFVSTTPPITAPAWTSFRTGLRPENHGIFSFFKPPEISLDIKDAKRHTAEDISSCCFWNMLNQNGKKVHIVDMPLTDPVEQINGVMVSGMMTRGKRGVLTCPQELGRELSNAFPNCFNRALSDGIDVSTDFLDWLIVSLEWKAKEDLYLMKHYEWDCFVTVFSAVDMLQHYYWRFIDPSSVFYQENPAVIQRANKFFSKLDSILAEYLEQTTSDDLLFIVSDHGFGPANYNVYVNNFLEELGLLKRKRGVASNFVSRYLNQAQLKKLVKKLDILHLLGKVSKEAREKIKNTLMRTELKIDWPATKAYFRANCEEGIYINSSGQFNYGSVKGSEYEAVVNLLTDRLNELINPQDGNRVFDFVKKRKDFLRGVFAKKAPDIFLRPRKGYMLQGYRAGKKIIEKRDDLFLSGTHEQIGIFFAQGPAFDHNYQANLLNIEDFVPTLLYSMKLPVPRNLDGKVCLDIFDEDFKNTNPIKFKDYNANQAKSFQNTITDSDEQEIRRQLSKLGYIE